MNHCDVQGSRLAVTRCEAWRSIALPFTRQASQVRNLRRPLSGLRVRLRGPRSTRGSSSSLCAGRSVPDLDESNPPGADVEPCAADHTIRLVPHHAPERDRLEPEVGVVAVLSLNGVPQLHEVTASKAMAQ